MQHYVCSCYVQGWEGVHWDSPMYMHIEATWSSLRGSKFQNLPGGACYCTL